MTRETKEAMGDLFGGLALMGAFALAAWGFCIITPPQCSAECDAAYAETAEVAE